MPKRAVDSMNALTSGRGWISAAAAPQLATLERECIQRIHSAADVPTRPRSLPQVDPRVANDGGGSGAAYDVAARLCEALEARVRVVHVAVAPHQTEAVVEQQRIHLVEPEEGSACASDGM